jgi:3-methyladenine DNA glycosylase Mpg
MPSTCATDRRVQYRSVPYLPTGLVYVYVVSSTLVPYNTVGNGEKVNNSFVVRSIKKYQKGIA